MANLADGIAKRYSYEYITGHAVGTTGAGGPSANDRQHNADSYALLACGKSLAICFRFDWLI